MFKMEIETDHHDIFKGTEGHSEVVRILRVLAQRIEDGNDGHRGGNLHDPEGKPVGWFRLDPL
jgi:hypothetical protein